MVREAPWHEPGWRTIRIERAAGSPKGDTLRSTGKPVQSEG